MAAGEFNPSAYTTWVTMTWVSLKEPTMLHEGKYTVRWSGDAPCGHPRPPWRTNGGLGAGSIRVLAGTP